MTTFKTTKKSMSIITAMEQKMEMQIFMVNNNMISENDANMEMKKIYDECRKMVELMYHYCQLNNNDTKFGNDDTIDNVIYDIYNHYRYGDSREYKLI